MRWLAAKSLQILPLTETETEQARESFEFHEKGMLVKYQRTARGLKRVHLECASINLDRNLVLSVLHRGAF